MSDSSPSRPATPFVSLKSAFGLGIALLSGFALVSVLAIAGRWNVFTLEQFEEVTAVGDPIFFKSATPFESNQVATNFNGQPLRLVDGEKVEIRDTKMLRVGRDESTQLTIYSLRAPLAPDPLASKKLNGPLFFLKIAPGEYLVARSGK